jgi:hypothetical protein
MKQFASWFTHGIPGGSTLRKQIFEAISGPAVLDAVEAFFANPAKPAAIGLRETVLHEDVLHEAILQAT